MRIFFFKAIKFLIALGLLPLFSPILREIWKITKGFNERTIFLGAFENPLSLCLGGMIVWVFFALLFRLPTRIYVFAHELTHALFIKLCGGEIKKISVGADSGYVLSNRSNFLIVLAPYLFPFYTILFGIGAALVALVEPVWRFKIPLWIGIGICLGYHWTMTGRMLFTRQTDFSSQGYFFSFVLILLTNFSLLLLLFLILLPPHNFLHYLQLLSGSVIHSYQATWYWFLNIISNIVYKIDVAFISIFPCF